MSESLRDMLKRHEGFRSRLYRDTQGHFTVGYGHNLDAGISQGLADLLLDEDIKTANNAVERLYPDFFTFTSARQSALMDFVFNVGEARAKGFVVMNAAINAGDWDTAANELQDSAWYGQVPNRHQSAAPC